RASECMTAISDHEFFAMIIFLVVLFFGLIYAWKKGALEWE
ncbi:NADH-quinone oxidoreductase subunit A, partial [Francisella tularensis]